MPASGWLAVRMIAPGMAPPAVDLNDEAVPTHFTVVELALRQ